MKPSKNGSIVIGHETIYPNQFRLAKRIMDVLARNEQPVSANKRCPLLVMPPQSGKTGVMIALIALFIQHCKKQGKTFQIIVRIGLPHIDLQKQTRDRLFQASKRGVSSGAELNLLAGQSGLAVYPDAPFGSDAKTRARYEMFKDDGILVLNNSTMLTELDLQTEVDCRLVISDESHAGNNKNGMFDTFLTHHGVLGSKQIHAWPQGRTVNHLVGVSATPGAHLLKGDVFVPIFENPPETYTGINHLFSSGRLRPTTKNIVTSGFFDDVYRDDFLPSCKKQGPGYLVVRVQGKKHTAFKKHLQKSKLDFLEFDANYENISELVRTLGVAPATPIIVIIRGAARAGITLTIRHYIHGWIEQIATDADIQAQSGVGRACGFFREKDTYPIYCDIKKATQWCEVYRHPALMDSAKDSITLPSRFAPVPKSRHVHAAPDMYTKTVTHGYVINNTYGLYGKALKNKVKDQTLKNKIKSDDGTKFLQVKSCSENLGHDIAGEFFRGVAAGRWMALPSGKEYRENTSGGVCLDGPTSQEVLNKTLERYAGNSEACAKARRNFTRNVTSFRNLKNSFPQYIGRTFTFKPSEFVSQGITSENLSEISNSCQKHTSALYDEALENLH